MGCLQGARRSTVPLQAGSQQGTSACSNPQAKHFEELTTHTFMVLFKETSWKLEEGNKMAEE